MHPAPTLPLVIDELRTECDGIVCVELVAADGTDLPAWDPGAHIEVHLGNGLSRQYSICSDPADPGHYTIAVLLDPHSRGGSRYIHDTFAKGDHLSTSLPRNNFPFTDAPQYLFVAGVIGITPLIPMMVTAQRRHRPYRLVYAGRDRSRMAFSGLLSHDPSVQLLVSGEGSRLDVAGLLDDDTHAAAEIFACGPPRLLDELTDHCRRADRQRHLHIERFVGTAVDLDADKERAFEVELARSGAVVTVGADQSILDALLAQGIKAPNSCAEGVCGSCETTIVEGTVDHRDQILDDDEKEENEVMMICCSRATSDRLVLDL
ncbi:PDR/VanB family oxidoreductase [Gordonia sp. VNK1]|uniref:PDR/VanB family oxidoreductase n=1 Tax=Gordonia oleivorans TaxID=3156618 RepID=UPI0032B540EF